MSAVVSSLPTRSPSARLRTAVLPFVAATFAVFILRYRNQPVPPQHQYHKTLADHNHTQPIHFSAPPKINAAHTENAATLGKCSSQSRGSGIVFTRRIVTSRRPLESSENTATFFFTRRLQSRCCRNFAPLVDGLRRRLHLLYDCRDCIASLRSLAPCVLETIGP